jgi:hypothetical protein
VQSQEDLKDTFQKESGPGEREYIVKRLKTKGSIQNSSMVSHKPQTAPTASKREHLPTLPMRPM